MGSESASNVWHRRAFLQAAGIGTLALCPCYIGMYNQREPFTDINVRRALST